MERQTDEQVDREIKRKERKLQQIYLKQGQTHTQKYEVVTGKHTNLTTVKILLAHFLKQDQEKKTF